MKDNPSIIQITSIHLNQRWPHNPFGIVLNPPHFLDHLLASYTTFPRWDPSLYPTSRWNNHDQKWMCMKEMIGAKGKSSLITCTPPIHHHYMVVTCDKMVLSNVNGTMT